MKQVLLFILLLIILAVGYLVGAHGPDPTQWFAPPTPTPTFTATSTYTSTSTNTSTATATSTFTPTATPTPKKKPVKKAPKKHARKSVKPDKEVTEDVDEPAPAPKKPDPPQPPERLPICNASDLSNALVEIEPNNTFLLAQTLGTLTSAGLQVHGTLSKVANVTDTAAADAYKADPNVENPDLDLDVYTFTTSSPFLVVLDCYTHIVGRPNPLYHENNYQLVVYNESYEVAGSSTQNNPVESVEIAGSGSKYYAVVYGVDGTGGNYRLTITQKGN